MRHGLWGISEPPRIPIFRFRKAAALDEVSVVRRIVRGQYGGRKLESIDQQTADVIGWIVDRPHHFSSSFRAKPIGRSFKERTGYIVIVDGFEQAKAADIWSVQWIVIRIITGHDAADDFAVFPRQK